MARKANQVGSKIIIANSRQRKEILFQDSVRAQGPRFDSMHMTLPFPPHGRNAAIADRGRH